MRVALVLALLLSMPGGARTHPQEPAPARLPQKGDRVVVRGCLSGPVLQAAEMTVAEADGKVPTAVTFRLSGDKKLLKEMRREDDGKLVEITGVLKSTLPAAEAPGKRVGNTRIVVGIGTPQGSERHGPPSMPVLEVKSYEPLVVSCGR